MNKQQLAAKIWESANKMRSKIEANEYNDYILGFYISYHNLFSTWIAKGRDFSVQDVRDALSAFNRLITFHQQKCDKLKNIKEFMLQNMFI